MKRYSTELILRTHVKGYGLLSFALTNMRKHYEILLQKQEQMLYKLTPKKLCIKRNKLDDREQNQS